MTHNKAGPRPPTGPGLTNVSVYRRYRRTKRTRLPAMRTGGARDRLVIHAGLDAAHATQRR